MNTSAKNSYGNRASLLPAVRRGYFPVMAGVLLLLVFMGFAPTLYLRFLFQPLLLLSLLLYDYVI